MAKKNTASSSKGTPRQGKRLRDEDKPELDCIIASGQPLWARLYDNEISRWEVLSVTVVPDADSPGFTVVDLNQEDFEQTVRPVLAPDRTKVVGLVALQIRWDRGVSSAERVRGKASGKLTITIRPPRSLDDDDVVSDLVSHEYPNIDVYIDD
jgi:hypothetical protein